MGHVRLIIVSTGTEIITALYLQSKEIIHHIPPNKPLEFL